tara:strand:+ start:2090 stop:2545 length:456 start_codon:yes stop_codon:yes gene_type:complete
MFRTHAAAGVLVALFFINSFSLDHPIFFFSIVFLSALLPDIDIPNSKIGQKIKPISWFLNFMFGHRKIFHSLFFSFLFFILLIILFENYIGAAFFLGYSVHLIVDGVTVRGIKPFYPLSSFELKGILRTGGTMDYLVFFLIVLLTIFLFLS